MELKRFEALTVEALDEILDRLREHRRCMVRQRLSVTAIAGPNGEYTKMLNIRNDYTKGATIIFTFADNTQIPPVVYPLAEPATCTIDDASKGTVTVLKDGTAGNGDGLVTVGFMPVAGATPGPWNLKCVGEGLADNSDEIDGAFAGAIVAADDNSVSASGSLNL